MSERKTCFCPEWRHVNEGMEMGENSQIFYQKISEVMKEVGQVVIGKDDSIKKPWLRFWQVVIY